MRVFVINLDRDKERMNHVDSQLKKLGVEYERISAVYGKALSLDEKKRAVNHFRWWCVVGHPVTDGEIGCALSHASIYRKIISEDIPMACILEDDVILDNRFHKVLEYVENNYPIDSPCIYLLSNHSDSVGQVGDAQCGYSSPDNTDGISCKKSQGDFFAEAYILGKSTAEALLRANFPIISPCDWWGRWVRLHYINLVHVFPTVARQDKSNYKSNTLPGIMQPVNTMPFFRRMLHKINRAIGITIDRIISSFGR